MTHSGPNRRSADLEADDGLRGDELAQRVEIGGEFPAEDRLVGGREAPPRVAQRDADGLGADVEPREATAVRECCGEIGGGEGDHPRPLRSEEHTSELQSLMRNSYAVFCLKKNKLTK